MSEKSWSVYQLIAYLKSRLDQDGLLRSLWVRGEISNFVAHHSGHFYFTLKDANARISCVMFASYATRLRFKVTDGMKVLIHANVSLYEKSGQLQLYVTEILDDGLGQLYQQYEELKAKLYQEGLFAIERKKALPAYPFSIGLISGKDTAARQDVLITLQRRWPVATIYEYPALVQGASAGASIINALAQADAMHHDVLILARGGGSLEDLWPFNEEATVRAVSNLNTPIITGIGHEVDFTLVDFVADQRANTPTGAAELAAPVYLEVRAEIAQHKKNLKTRIRQKTEQSRLLMNQLIKTRLPQLSVRLMERRSLNLMMLLKSLSQFPKQLERIRLSQRSMQQRLLARRGGIIEANTYQLKENYARMNIAMQQLAVRKKETLSHRAALLDAYSPLKILSRGYGVITYQNKVLRSVDDINVNDELSIQLTDGTLKAQVTDKE